MPILMAQVLRLYILMVLSYELYICIILETAHHRTTFGIFCNFTQKTIPEKKNNQKMFHISSLIVLFSYGKVKDIFLEIRIKFHPRRTKGRDRGGMGGEAQNNVCVVFLSNAHYYTRYNLYLTNFWSHKLPTTTIATGMPKNQYLKIFKWFQAVLPGQKQLCVF